MVTACEQVRLACARVGERPEPIVERPRWPVGRQRVPNEIQRHRNDGNGSLAAVPITTSERRYGHHMRAAVLDMGSTSFHLLVADVEGEDITEVHREREYLELGAMLARDGRLSDDAMDEAAAIALFAHARASEADAQVFVALATSAIRDAPNGRQLADRLNTETPWDVKVIDGDEEARLVFLGQAAALAAEGRLTAALDLGGGSLELAIEQDGGLITASLPFGAGRVAAGLSSDDADHRDQLVVVANAVATALAGYRPLAEPGTIAGISGGSVRALARAILGEQPKRRFRDSVNGCSLTRDALADFAARVGRLDVASRSLLPGVGRRGATLHAAATVVSSAVDALGLESVVVSEWGMREGALLLSTGRSGSDDDRSLRRRRAMEAWVRRSRGDLAHGEHVAGVASWLFQLTSAHHRLGESDHEVLHLAAMAHAAMCVDPTDDDRRTIAALRADAPRGLSLEDVDLVCSVLRPPRRSSRDSSTVRVLAALLQVADALDADRERPIRQLRLVDGANELRLLAHGSGDLAQACAAAQRGARSLTALLGRRLVVVPASA